MAHKLSFWGSKRYLWRISYSILKMNFTNQIVFSEILSNRIKFEQIKAIKVIGTIPYIRLYSRIFINILCSFNSFSFYKTKFTIFYYIYINLYCNAVFPFHYNSRVNYCRTPLVKPYFIWFYIYEKRCLSA